MSEGADEQDRKQQRVEIEAAHHAHQSEDDREEVGGAEMGSLNDQLVKHIDEAIAMEENVKRMLDGMIQTSDDRSVIGLLEQRKVETEQHSQRLRERLKAHGASSSMVREATSILPAHSRSCRSTWSEARRPAATRATATRPSMEIAAYQLLGQLRPAPATRRQPRSRG